VADRRASVISEEQSLSLAFPQVSPRPSRQRTIISPVQSGYGIEPQIGRYISVPQTIQLIPKSFDGNPIELREFVQNVDSTYEVVDALDYELLFKFVCAKVAGEQRLNY